MPFTPFHLGAGAAFKAAGGPRFGFLIFAGSQVLMDIEPLVRIIQGSRIVHGPSHTVVGALVIGLVSGAIGRPVVEITMRLLRIGHRKLTWAVAFASAFIGTYSHVALDAVMHPDLQPLWPFAEANPLLGLISVGWLHVTLLIAGLLGLLVMALRQS